MSVLALFTGSALWALALVSVAVLPALDGR
mgnify:FL=1